MRLIWDLIFGKANRTYPLYFSSQLCWKLHFNNFGFGSLDWSFSGSASSCSVDISAVSSLCCCPKNSEHYGTLTNWSTLTKKLMQTYIVKVSGSILNISTVHLNGIWHLIWHYLLKPVLGRHLVLSGHYSIPQGCPLNTGFTVITKTQTDFQLKMIYLTCLKIRAVLEFAQRWVRQF